MDEQFYVLTADGERGPFSAAELVAEFASGKLRDHQFVRSGNGKWTMDQVRSTVVRGTLESMPPCERDQLLDWFRPGPKRITNRFVKAAILAVCIAAIIASIVAPLWILLH